MNELTLEEFVYIFTNRNLLKGVFMQYPQDKDPRFSYEIAIDLEAGMKDEEEPPYKVNPSTITHLHTTTVLDVNQSQFTQNGWEQGGFKLGTPWSVLAFTFDCFPNILVRISVAREVERQNLSEVTKMKETVFTTSSKEYQRGWILFDKDELKLSKKLLKQIDTALELPSEDEIKAKLAELFNDKWGHVLRLEVLLGGALFNHMETEKSSEVSVQVLTFFIAFSTTLHQDTIKSLESSSRNALELKVQQIKIKGSAEVGIADSTQLQQGKQTITSSWDFKVMSSHSFTEVESVHNSYLQGGNTLLAGETSIHWAPTIGDPKNWDVIRVRKTILLIDLLDKDRRTRVSKYAPALAVQPPVDPVPNPMPKPPPTPVKPAVLSYDPTGNSYDTDKCGGGLRHSLNRMKDHLTADYPGSFVFVYTAQAPHHIKISQETPPDGYSTRVSGAVEIPTGKGYTFQYSQRVEWYVFKKAKFEWVGPNV